MTAREAAWDVMALEHADVLSRAGGLSAANARREGEAQAS